AKSADNTGCLIEHFGNADAVPQLPERCLSRKAGIVRCCPKTRGRSCAPFYSIHIYQQANCPQRTAQSGTSGGNFYLFDYSAVGFCAVIL
ncbi:MAG: hypothetical protein ACLR51_00610, partial [Subdoligranulum sp.]